jgi:hypothetical protein
MGGNHAQKTPHGQIGHRKGASLMKGIAALLGMFVVAPIWYYLLYKILVAVNANELMWFLYIIYIPVSLIVQACMKLAEKEPR